MQTRIRNFSIIAHIDHGKSTLADRLLEYTGAITLRESREQILDAMDLERERGITIKAHTVTVRYKAEDGEEYLINLIDTPGHVDFTYEVSRSLAACEGALLDNGLTVIPVINKVDLASADVEGTKKQIEDVLSLETHDAVLTSAKAGLGTKEVLEAIVRRVPPPTGTPDGPLKALVFDSWFDNYQGVTVLARVGDGNIHPGLKVRMMGTDKVFEIQEVGIFNPKRVKQDRLSMGEVGYVVAGIRRVGDTRIGDTITEAERPAAAAYPGYKEAKPMVFCGLYSTDTEQFEDLRDALEKLRLNDSSFVYEPETSLALGFGFRCGFLGLLHMEIIQERLEREFALELISTTPTVVYRVTTTKQDVLLIDNPNELPEPNFIERFEEPYIKATIITPEAYVGNLLALCQERRGTQKGLTYLNPTRVMLVYEMPLSEIVLDFYDRLKSKSQGYASLDYEIIGYQPAELVRVDILLNGESVDAMSFIVHRDKAALRGRQVAEKMKEFIPRQMFEVAIQAAIGNKIIARELKITEGTVKVHVKGLLRKIKASNRTQVAIWALRQSHLFNARHTVEHLEVLGHAD